MDEMFTIETERFEHREVKPHFINPCCFGEDFAAWLRPKLADLTAQGFDIGEPIQEDYGWGFWVTRGKETFWIALSYMGDGPTEEPAQWGVSVTYASGLNFVRRMFHKPDASAFSVVRDRVFEALKTTDGIRILVDAQRDRSTSVNETLLSHRRRVLFLCTGNSCRSQMAEGWLRQLAGDRFESLSAGANPAGYVHPLAVQVMRESGVDISQQVSKHIRQFLPPEGTPPDLIISVCGHAEKECPLFPARVERWHWPFDDPAHATGTDVERLAEFRRVRDEIKAKIESGLVAS